MNDAALDLERTMRIPESAARDLLPEALLGGRIERGVFDPDAASAFLGVIAESQASQLRPDEAVQGVIEVRK